MFTLGGDGCIPLVLLFLLGLWRVLYVVECGSPGGIDGRGVLLRDFGLFTAGPFDSVAFASVRGMAKLDEKTVLCRFGSGSRVLTSVVSEFVVGGRCSLPAVSISGDV